MKIIFMSVLKVGIVGFGHLGQYLYTQIVGSTTHEVAFVWNRTADKIVEFGVPQNLILADLDGVKNVGNVDIIVEVAHPDITRTYGELFLSVADYFVGSPTIFADAEVDTKLRYCPFPPSFIDTQKTCIDR